ncbi:Acid phosphatase/vanadium-dependent haloperoxidase-related protein [Striga hermonthica]|uniref:Acid phosphatase/vanadium-dependent haloperoxidase-related protein n=1 Tax=Striga hermonthica TaxID=68872 RepID=A0A9N7NS17_STRHE|nr:Acid phosphatase/vanadium-dependent haloperoxidase-related protein [Striga hermonthica]
MSLTISDFLPTPSPTTVSNFRPKNAHLLSSHKHCAAPFRCVSELACHSFAVDEVAGVFHNKVLVAAGLSAAIGQLSKPFTSTLLYGKKFDLKGALQAGGFPSTHSSSELRTVSNVSNCRGFSDSVFGLAVVYAGLIMYDAQGVRREVGVHAKQINKVLLQTTSYSRDLSSNVEKTDPVFLEEQKPTKSALLLKSDKTMQTSKVEFSSSSPLKESIGHTEVEVIAGALLGLLVSLVVCPYV